MKPPAVVERQNQTETGVGSVGVQEIWQGVQRGAKPTIAFSYIKFCMVFPKEWLYSVFLEKNTYIAFP